MQCFILIRRILRVPANSVSVVIRSPKWSLKALVPMCAQFMHSTGRWLGPNQTDLYTNLTQSWKVSNLLREAIEESREKKRYEAQNPFASFSWCIRSLEPIFISKYSTELDELVDIAMASYIALSTRVAADFGDLLRYGYGPTRRSLISLGFARIRHRKIRSTFTGTAFLSPTSHSTNTNLIEQLFL